jgi:hypothetical protein
VYIQWITYSVLKSIDFANFANVLMCFLVICSNGGGQVSPVWTMAFCRILMTYIVLKSIDFANFANVLMCFLVICSNGGGQVSAVWTMTFCRILLSFSSFVQFIIIWLIVCSSFILQGHVELGMNLNLWRYDLVKPWPVTRRYMT